MQVEDRGLIYDATARPDAEGIAFFTALCPLRSGTIHLSAAQTYATSSATATQPRD